MGCIHYLIQCCWSKQKHNPLHEMDFPTYNNSNIDQLSQIEMIKNKAVWGAWIFHNKMQSTKENSTKGD